MDGFIFKVGDMVAVIRSGEKAPIALHRVTAIREFKRNTKVTLENGTEYTSFGSPWTKANSIWDVRPTIRPARPEDAAMMKRAQSERALLLRAREIGRRHVEKLSDADLNALNSALKGALEEREG